MDGGGVRQRCRQKGRKVSRGDPCLCVERCFPKQHARPIAHLVGIRLAHAGARLFVTEICGGSDGKHSIFAGGCCEGSPCCGVGVRCIAARMGGTCAQYSQRKALCREPKAGPRARLGGEATRPPPPSLATTGIGAGPSRPALCLRTQHLPLSCVRSRKEKSSGSAAMTLRRDMVSFCREEGGR